MKHIKKAAAIFLAVILLLTSCTMGDFCKITDEQIRIFNNITEAFVSEGDDVYFYSTKPLYNVCVHQMEWDYVNESYSLVQTVVSGITLDKNDALKIVYNNGEMPYIRVTFTYSNGKEGERYIYKDQNDRLWLLEHDI